MKNTVMPLSIAFFDQGGTYLDAFDMAPCTADPCPVYPTPANFVNAIEVPQGMLDELGDRTRQRARGQRPALR